MDQPIWHFPELPDCQSKSITFYSLYAKLSWSTAICTLLLKRQICECCQSIELLLKCFFPNCWNFSLNLDYMATNEFWASWLSLTVNMVFKVSVCQWIRTWQIMPFKLKFLMQDYNMVSNLHKTWRWPCALIGAVNETNYQCWSSVWVCLCVHVCERVCMCVCLYKGGLRDRDLIREWEQRDKDWGRQTGKSADLT